MAAHRLTELDAELKPTLYGQTVLRFRCPKDGCSHSIRWTLGQGTWTVTAGSTIEDLSVHPSLRVVGGCKGHWNLEKGVLIDAPD